MAWTEEARWFEARLAHNRKPAHYRCPLCGRQLPSMSEHMLLFPEGDHSRRRHAHSACVLAARKQGKLLTRDEWRRAQGRGAEERRFSARRILWALRPKLKRSRPSDS
ncbi:MAG TPA: hypothetical protein VME01_05430 [Solirubrobacteraceae bacterium]|nr:hypothetical protein [Solirubrobacteraceae bacterium]